MNHMHHRDALDASDDLTIAPNLVLFFHCVSNSGILALKGHIADS